MPLTVPELRVLGALIEKEITTPETYPLSLNALQAAANQRSSRDPVLDLGEEELRQALHALEDLGLVTPVRDSRVAKWEHRARTILNLRRDETALLCLLLLRGPQTPGELRSRSDRLYPFDDLAAVTATLDRLAARPPVGEDDSSTPGNTGPLTAALPRQPGSRETRYTHLLGAAVAGASLPASPVTAANQTSSIDELRAEIEQLRQEFAAVQRRLDLLEGKSLPTA